MRKTQNVLSFSTPHASFGTREWTSEVFVQAYLIHGNLISLDCEASKRNPLVYEALAYQHRLLENR